MTAGSVVTLSSLPEILGNLESPAVAARAQGASQLAQLVDSSDAATAVEVGNFLRETDALPLVLDLLLDRQLRMVQCALMVLGNLSSDAFDPNSMLTAKILFDHDVLKVVKPFFTPTTDDGIQVYAAGLVQNVCKTCEFAEKALSCGVVRALELMLTDAQLRPAGIKRELIIRYTSGALSNIAEQLKTSKRVQKLQSATSSFSIKRIAKSKEVRTVKFLGKVKSSAALADRASGDGEMRSGDREVRSGEVSTGSGGERVSGERAAAETEANSESGMHTAVLGALQTESSNVEILRATGAPAVDAADGSGNSGNSSDSELKNLSGTSRSFYRPKTVSIPEEEHGNPLASAWAGTRGLSSTELLSLEEPPDHAQSPKPPSPAKSMLRNSSAWTDQSTEPPSPSLSQSPSSTQPSTQVPSSPSPSHTLYPEVSPHSGATSSQVPTDTNETPQAEGAASKRQSRNAARDPRRTKRESRRKKNTAAPQPAEPDQGEEQSGGQQQEQQQPQQHPQEQQPPPPPLAQKHHNKQQKQQQKQQDHQVSAVDDSPPITQDAIAHSALGNKEMVSPSSPINLDDCAGFEGAHEQSAHEEHRVRVGEASTLNHRDVGLASGKAGPMVERGAEAGSLESSSQPASSANGQDQQDAYQKEQQQQPQQQQQQQLLQEQHRHEQHLPEQQQDGTVLEACAAAWSKSARCVDDDTERETGGSIWTDEAQVASPTREIEIGGSGVARTGADCGRDRDGTAAQSGSHAGSTRAGLNAGEIACASEIVGAGVDGEGGADTSDRVRDDGAEGDGVGAALVTGASESAVGAAAPESAQESARLLEVGGARAMKRRPSQTEAACMLQKVYRGNSTRTLQMSLRRQQECAVVATEMQRVFRATRARRVQQGQGERPSGAKAHDRTPTSTPAPTSTPLPTPLQTPACTAEVSFTSRPMGQRALRVPSASFNSGSKSKSLDSSSEDEVLPASAPRLRSQLSSRSTHALSSSTHALSRQKSAHMGRSSIVLVRANSRSLEDQPYIDTDNDTDTDTGTVPMSGSLQHQASKPSLTWGSLLSPLRRGDSSAIGVARSQSRATLDLRRSRSQARRLEATNISQANETTNWESAEGSFASAEFK